MAVRNGSDDAVGELLKLQWARLYGMAERRLKGRVASKESASDVVQETFLEATQTIHDFRGESLAEFEGWLNRVQRNREVAVHRRYGTRKRQATREVSLNGGSAARRVVDVIDPQPSPSSQVRAKERDPAMEAAMARLTEEERLPLHMHYDENLGFTEIGLRLECSPDAARMRVKRALKKLKRYLKKPDGSR